MLDKTYITCLIKLNIYCVHTISVVLMLVSIPEFTALILGFQNGDRPPSWILKFSQLLSKIQIITYFYVHVQNLVKIGRPAAELLRVFDFQNGGHPPSLIWYDVISDHSRLVFNGPNILLKLHVDRLHTLQDIAIFIFGRFGLKLHIYESFWGVFGDITLNEVRYCRNPQKDRPWAKTRRTSHKS